MNESDDIDRAHIRKSKILQNAENRMRKIQSLYSNTSNSIIADTESSSDKEKLRPIHQEEINSMEPIQQENIYNNANSQQSPSEPYLRKRNTENSSSDIFKEEPKIASLENNLADTPYLYRPVSQPSRIYSIFASHMYIQLISLAIIVRILLSSEILGFIVFKSAILPFVVLQTVLYFIKDNEAANKNNNQPLKMLRSVLIISKFDPILVNLLINILIFSQSLTKNFSIYIVTFIIFHQIIA